MRFSLRRSPADPRDHVYSTPEIILPEKVDLRQYDSLVEDQGNLSSCAGLAATSCYELMLGIQNRYLELSDLFIYYNSRALENNQDKDDGVYTLRSVMKSLKEFGAASEEIWPYDSAIVLTKPSEAAYQDGLPRAITEYSRIMNLEGAEQSLANQIPVEIGMPVYSDFMKLDSENFLIKAPAVTDYILGGHAVMMVGYDRANQWFIIKNSFGTEWGMNGYAYLDYDYYRKYVWESWNFTIPENQVLIEP